VSNVTDGQRTGYGLNKLRERYIRRAEHLVRDSEYIDLMNDLRGTWNRAYPEYELGGGGISPTPFCMPKSLHNDLERWAEESRPVIKQLASRKRTPYGNPWEGIENSEREVRNRFQNTAWAESDWADTVLALTERLFPEADFYNPLYPEHAATRFIAACLYADPRLIDDCGEYFLPFRVELRRQFGSDDTPYTDLSLPLYPGMTVKDLREAAPDIVAAVNARYADKTPDARIIALRGNGLTHKAIADRLGLTEQTVAATLKDANILTPENG